MPLICLKEDINNEKLCEFIDGRETEGIKSDIAFIYFSSAYALASELAVKNGSMDFAWQLMCQANFYYALTISTDRKEEIYTKSVLSGYQADLSAKGAKKRGESFEPYRARTIEILKTRKWDGLGHAQNVIAKKLRVDFPGAENVKYRPSTITAWIKTLSEQELDELIPSYRSRQSRGASAAKKQKN